MSTELKYFEVSTNNKFVVKKLTSKGHWPDLQHSQLLSKCEIYIIINTKIALLAIIL
jgi:hypothetical protein